MTYTLLKKEVRQLIPLGIFMVVITISDVIYRLIDERLDESSWSDISGYLLQGTENGYGIFYTVFAFMFAFSLFPREHDEKTIDFLYSMPVKRLSVFSAKFLAAILILEATLLLGVFQDWALHLFNPQAFSGNQFQFNIALAAWFLISSFIFIMLSYGVFLSFFRRFGLILFGLYWWTIYSFERIYPSFAYINFLNILSMEYRGQTLLIPWRLLGINLVIAVIILLSGVFLWLTPSENYSMWYSRLRQKRWGRILSATSMVFIIIFFIMIINKIINNEEHPRDLRVKFSPFESSTFTTQHYRFTYPLNLRESAQKIIKNADMVYEKTRSAMSADFSNPVIVDFTEESTEHAGIGGWHKIRMDIRGNMELDKRLRIFSHETVHVLALLESNRKITKYSDETYFFNEGLAEYVSFAVYPDKEKMSAHRLLAVTSWKRYDIRFDELVGSSSFIKKHNSYLFYALGETWVNAIAQVCGRESLGSLLRTMAREDAPSDLEGVVFWQDTFQAMDCDLEKVNGLWLKELKADSKKYKAEIDRLPRITGGVARREGQHLVLIAALDRDIPNADTTFIVRYRNNWNDSEEEVGMVYGVVVPDKKPVEIEFAIPLYYLPNKKFEYQLGYAFKKEALPYFELWQPGEIK